MAVSIVNLTDIGAQRMQIQENCWSFTLLSDRPIPTHNLENIRVEQPDIVEAQPLIDLRRTG